ncbi:dihydroorotate oxidase B catalytic subunit [Hydrogenispora ethanolica]|jgi:dihydroorotate dehydrogenase (NAD+) catalytic subunit|uniref:Dihydroorotate dehydrogenase n=1 Tax=Hydrogenispora ethanolica TaxID=1082276 RepID=A0A4R1QMG7_HYDET|nr:dihydroorotate dehydrogenase [Hydrogenispora ethanolica]TCL54866.1 dihydroorotate oxidase B catalytic subunit [Hydrogenispora ethanolica]
MNEPSLEIRLAGLTLRNPVLPASGTYGYGREYLPFFAPDTFGAVVTKGVSLEPWPGNPPPRVYETPAGMLNAIGLQNPGVEAFIREAIPFLRPFQTPVIVNVVGKTIPDYVGVVERLTDYSEISGFELNISCPNVKEGGMAFGTDPETAYRVTREVRRATRKPLIVKLSPNVTDVTLIAQRVEEAGADCLSLINTLLGMAIDIRKGRPVLANVVGGLSGPAIKPVALRMVWQVYRKVSLPLIGIGGIATAADAIEFMMAGASAVAIGTGTFHDPMTPARVVAGIKEFLAEQRTDLKSLIGLAHRAIR